jgi:hypothetical protein
VWSQIPDGSLWLNLCDKIEADLPPNLQLTVMFHLCDAGQPKECLVLDFPQTNLTKAELTTLRTTLGERYWGTLNFLAQPNNVYVPYFRFPSTILSPQQKPAASATSSSPVTNLTPPVPPAIPVSTLPEKQVSPIAQFNKTYCALCPTKCTTNETYLRCLATLSFQELQTHTTLLTELADHPKCPKKEPLTERHILDGISWMSCEGQKGPYEKALEKENAPNDVYAAWKRILQDGMSAGKKGQVISGTKDDQKVDYWCWLNTYEGEVSICRRLTQQNRSSQN